MAKVIFHQLLEAMRGRIGRVVLRQRPDGTFIISGTPSYRKGKASPKQKAHRERMKDAAQYAKWADDVYPIYAQLAKGNDKWLSPYNVALSDWFHAPVIHCVERREGLICVEASDNVLVTKVQVSVLDEEGSVLETGEAVPGEENWWAFVSSAEGTTIVAEAWDLPGNVSRFGLLRPAGTSPRVASCKGKSEMKI
jgi:hypothetical protein